MSAVAREVHTAEEIRAEVHRRIHEGREVRDDDAEISVPLPQAYGDGIREPNGSNWHMEVFGNSSGYEGWVLHVLYSVQSRWDLAT